MTRADAVAVEGSKNFQLEEVDQSEQLNLRISCATQDGGKAQVFVSALQDRYALKKSSTTASVGVGVLGSLSLPVGSSGDSLVRVSSTTVQDAAFYKRFFERLNAYLPRSPKRCLLPQVQRPRPHMRPHQQLQPRLQRTLKRPRHLRPPQRTPRRLRIRRLRHCLSKRRTHRQHRRRCRKPSPPRSRDGVFTLCSKA